MAVSLSKSLRLRLPGGGHRLLPSRPSTSHASQPPPPPSPPPPSAATPPPPGAGKEASAWSKLFLFAPGAITFGLGTWQLFRRREEMLDYRTRWLEMEPIAWNDVSLSAAMHDPAALEFRKIVCEGDFDEEKSVFVGPLRIHRLLSSPPLRILLLLLMNFILFYLKLAWCVCPSIVFLWEMKPSAGKE